MTRRDSDGRLSGFTTRGRCLLAGGLATAACSLVLNERDLLRIGIFVAMLPLLGFLLAARTRRALRVQRKVVPQRLPVGSTATVELHLHGRALLGALRVVDTVPDAAGPQPTAPPRFTVHRLSGRGVAAMNYPLQPVLRGIHRIGPLSGTVTDPVGLAEFERQLLGDDRILVLPRVVALRGMPPALGAGEGTPGAALAHQGQGASDVLIRQYRPGDELRRVHWKSTARHDELMVRLEERPWRGGMIVMLDRRDVAHRGRGAASSLEFAVTLIASITAHLIARGEPVQLVTEDGVALSEGAGLDPVLDALAALRPSARPDLTGPELTQGSDVLAVLGAVGPGQVEGLLARRTSGGHAIVLDTATWDPAVRRPGSSVAVASALRGAGWHVVEAGAGADPARVWDDLTTGAAPDGRRAG